MTELVDDIRATEFDEPEIATSPPVPTRRARRRFTSLGRANATVIAIYTVISLIADFPIWPGDPSRVPTMLGEDIYQTTWFLEWTPWALLHGHNVFDTTAINYPVGVDLAQNTGMQLLALITAPLTLAVSPVASMNLLRFLAFVLSAYAVYHVLKRMTNNDVPASFVGGLLYGFSPYMITQGSVHLNLMFVPLPPLLLYGLFDLLVTRKMSPARRGVLLGLGAAAQFYISAEVLATTGIIAGIGAFCLFFLCVTEVRQRAAHVALGLAVGGVVTAVLIAYPLAIMLHGAAHYRGPAQGFHNTYNADLLGSIVPTTFQLVAPQKLAMEGAHLVGSQIQENGSYLSIPLIVLVVYFVGRFWRRLWPLYLAMLALVSWMLSLGAALVVNGKTHPLPFNLPFEKIEHLPVVENILPVRFSLYETFFVAVIVALGIAGIREDRRARRALPAPPRQIVLRRNVIAAIGVTLGVAAAVAMLPNLPYSTYPLHQNYATSAKGLRIVPVNAVVLAYPYPTPFDDAPMLWQALDDMRFNLIGAYALVPNPFGNASVFPSRLHPVDVEAALVDSISPVPEPGYPDIVATTKTVVASVVTVHHSGYKVPAGTVDEAAGRVTWVHNATIYIRHGVTPLVVHVTDATHYQESWAKRPSLAGVVPGEVVVVQGTIGPGTIDPTLVNDLRTFLRVNHVTTVVVGLGVTDGYIVGSWFKDALGRSTRAGGGGLVWTNVQADLARSA